MRVDDYEKISEICFTCQHTFQTCLLAYPRSFFSHIFSLFDAQSRVCLGDNVFHLNLTLNKLDLRTTSKQMRRAVLCNDVPDVAH